MSINKGGKRDHNLPKYLNFILLTLQGVSQRYSPPLELNPKGLGKKQKYCYKLYQNRNLFRTLNQS